MKKQKKVKDQTKYKGLTKSKYPCLTNHLIDKRYKKKEDQKTNLTPPWLQLPQKQYLPHNFIPYKYVISKEIEGNYSIELSNAMAHSMNLWETKSTRYLESHSSHN